MPPLLSLPHEQPVLETARLVLRPLKATDAKAVQTLAGDKRVAETTKRVPHPYEDGLAEAWIATHRPDWETQRNLVYAITLKPSLEFIGCIGLEDLTAEAAELGYWIGVPFWGQGYCTEATKELIRIAFDQFGIKKIVAWHYLFNPASGRVMRKAGMRHVGQAKNVGRDGSSVDVVLYEIER